MRMKENYTRENHRNEKIKNGASEIIILIFIKIILVMFGSWKILGKE